MLLNNEFRARAQAVAHAVVEPITPFSKRSIQCWTLASQIISPLCSPGNWHLKVNCPLEDPGTKEQGEGPKPREGVRSVTACPH